MIKSLHHNDKRAVWRASFNTLASIARNKGTASGITIDLGIATFDGSTNLLSYRKRLNSVYTFAFDFVPEDTSTVQYLADFRKDGGTGFIRISANIIDKTSGTVYVNGEPTNDITGLAGTKVHVVVAGITVDCTEINVGNAYGSGNKYEGTMKLIDGFVGTFTAEEAKGLYNTNLYLPPGPTAEEYLGPEINGSWTNSPTYPYETYLSTGGDNLTIANTVGLGGAYGTNIAVVAGEIYKVTFDYVDGGGGVYPEYNGLYASPAGIGGTSSSQFTVVNGANEHYIIITASGNASLVIRTGGVGDLVDGAITNFSLKKVLRGAYKEILSINCLDGIIEEQYGNVITNNGAELKRMGSKYGCYTDGITYFDSGSALPMTGNLSFIGWFEYKNYPEASRYFFDNGKLRIFVSGSRPNDKIYVRSNGSTNTLTASLNMPDNKPFCLAFIRMADGRTSIYVNTVISGSIGQNGNPPGAGTTPLYHGAVVNSLTGFRYEYKFIEGLINEEYITRYYNATKHKYGL